MVLTVELFGALVLLGTVVLLTVALFGAVLQISGF